MTRYILLGTGIFAVLAAVELAFGLHRRPGVLTMRELGASLLAYGHTIGIRAVMFGGVTLALEALWPGSRGALAGVSFWLLFLPYLLITDYGFYYVHRKSHETPWLWRLHKPHHAPRSLNIAVTYRENWLWVLLMAETWLSPVILWLGRPDVYAAVAVFRTSVTLLVHSELRWDLLLQRNRLTRPIMWVIERVITLPDVHHVHHGAGRHGDAMKNYGAALSLFDLLHGTLVIPHARQEGFGLPEGTEVEPWAEQLFWPLVRSKKVTGRPAPVIAAPPAAAPSAPSEGKAVIRTADGRTILVS